MMCCKKFTIPKKDYWEKQAAIVVRAGGVDMPPGYAHFLEHKLFEDSELNLLEAFTKHGASVNAYTHNTHTVYYFNTIDAFEENLTLLKKLVFEPHFTEENIEKEKGIILAEIDMYADNPFWQVYTALNRALFNKPDILGTKESILAITPQDLYDCYKRYYRPDNMALICVGDFDTEFLDYNEDIPILQIEDSSTDFIEQSMLVPVPMFQLGFKAIYNKMSPPLQMAASSILADMIFGESSTLYAELYEKGMIDNQFSTEYIGAGHYGIFMCSGVSPQPEAVRDRILQEVANFKIEKDRFNLIKNKHIGRFIRGFNSIETLASVQADLFAKGTNINAMLDAFKNVTIDDVAAESLNKHALSVIRGEKQ